MSWKKIKPLQKLEIILIFLVIFFLGSYFFYQTYFFSKIVNNSCKLVFLKFHNFDLSQKICKINPKLGIDYYTNYLLGRIYFVQNNPRLSIRHYAKSIELNPVHKESYYGRGLTYGFMGNMFLEEAEKDFQKYIDIDNQEFQKTGLHAFGAWAGYNDLAWIYFLQGKFSEAEKTSLQGLEMSPENPWLLNMLATSLIEQDKCKEAKTYLEQAQFFVSKMSVEEFGEAYTGDNSKWWPKGLKEMQQTIQDNIKLCLAKF